MKKLLLTLAEDTTDAHCRSCPFSERVKATLRCGPFDQILDIASVPMGPMLRGNYITGRRLPECLAAEQAAARLVDIAPESARDAINAGGFTDPECVMDEWKPVLSALAEHAEKAGG